MLTISPDWNRLSVLLADTKFVIKNNDSTQIKIFKKLALEGCLGCIKVDILY